jgi:excisionase family DNA binding protein
MRWSDPSTPELLGLGVELLEAGDARGLTLLRRVLTAECGPAFAAAVATAIATGTPPGAFDFLPAVPPRRRAPAADPPPPPPAAAPAVPRPARALPGTGYVRAADVAAHFGVSVKAVYRWMATGRIRAERRPGGSYRIPADQFRPGAPPGA